MRLIFSAILIFFFFAHCKKVTEVTGETNNPPVANAGPYKEATMPATGFTLSGSGTDDDGQVVAYLWSQVNGPGQTVITNPGSATTTVSGFSAGNYLFQLMVTDNKGATGVDTVSVKINPSQVTQTLTLQPANNPNEKILVSLGSQDLSSQGGNEWIIDAWTMNGQTFVGRVAFKFDLSSIPSNATIQTANLFLYSNTPPENGNLVDANFGANNGLMLYRITSNWSAGSANWSNQPAISSTDQIAIPQTSSPVLDINIDVKNQVAHMVNNNANHGFLLKLQDETPHKSRAFVSSYHAAKPQLRPKLIVTYQ